MFLSNNSPFCSQAPHSQPPLGEAPPQPHFQLQPPTFLDTQVHQTHRGDLQPEQPVLEAGFKQQQHCSLPQTPPSRPVPTLPTPRQTPPGSAIARQNDVFLRKARELQRDRSEQQYSLDLHTAGTLSQRLGFTQSNDGQTSPSKSPGGNSANPFPSPTVRGPRTPQRTPRRRRETSRRLINPETAPFHISTPEAGPSCHPVAPPSPVSQTKRRESFPPPPPKRKSPPSRTSWHSQVLPERAALPVNDGPCIPVTPQPQPVVPEDAIAHLAPSDTLGQFSSRFSGSPLSKGRQQPNSGAQPIEQPLHSSTPQSPYVTHNPDQFVAQQPEQPLPLPHAAEPAEPAPCRTGSTQSAFFPAAVPWQPNLPDVIPAYKRLPPLQRGSCPRRPYPSVDEDTLMRWMLNWNPPDQILTIADFSYRGWKTERMISALVGGLLRTEPPQLVIVGSQRYEHLKGTINITPDHITHMNMGTCRVDEEAVLHIHVQGVVFHHYAPDAQWGQGWRWYPLEKAIPPPDGEIRIRGPRQHMLSLRDKIHRILAPVLIQMQMDKVAEPSDGPSRFEPLEEDHSDSPQPGCNCGSPSLNVEPTSFEVEPWVMAAVAASAAQLASTVHTLPQASPVTVAPQPVALAAAPNSQGPSVGAQTNVGSGGGVAALQPFPFTASPATQLPYGAEPSQLTSLASPCVTGPPGPSTATAATFCAVDDLAVPQAPPMGAFPLDPMLQTLAGAPGFPTTIQLQVRTQAVTDPSPAASASASDPGFASAGVSAPDSLAATLGDRPSAHVPFDADLFPDSWAGLVSAVSALAQNDSLR